MSESHGVARDFIRQIVADGVAAGVNGGRVTTRFPPEPNGFLHIGHAKAICLDFGVAEEFGGTCNLRMDDTNPETADPKYVDAIADDIRWLGFEWDGAIRFASDYYARLIELAVGVIRDGKAYVDSSSEEEIRERRGTVTEPGRPSPYRDRSIEENLDLFDRMCRGEFEEGAHVLRAKIDLAHPNMKMRDPLLYRIRKTPHYRTGDAFSVYPFYDWAHPLSDAIEGITHSFCTLEFEVNRPLYDWAVDHTRPNGPSSEPGSWDPRPRQYEFARLNLDYTVMSKRKLLRLVREGRVAGWDDPRMPTLAAFRRRGVPPEAIRTFIESVGVTKADQRVDIGKLEHATRDVLNYRAPRVMCVLRPLRLVVENYPDGETEWMQAPYYPRDVDKPGSRRIPFSRTLLIERDDFREDPPKGYYRLAPRREVRLRYGYFVRCTDVVRDEAGEVVEVRCTYDPETRGGDAPDGRKVRGTIHWVSAEHALPAEVRLYDRLFAVADPEAGVEDFAESLNPDSLVVLDGARIEPSVADDPPETPYQFERRGYFVRDGEGSVAERLIFNQTVPLRDTWSRRAESGDGKATRGRRPPSGPSGSTTAARADAGSATAAGSRRPGSGERRAARAENTELADKYRRYRDELELSEEHADILSGDAATARLFEGALSVHDDPTAVANWIVHDFRGLASDRDLDDLPFGGAQLGALIAMIQQGTITATVARQVAERMLEGGGEPHEIVEAEGLQRMDTTDTLAPIVRRVLDAHPDEVERYRSGQTNLMGFFVGLVMRATHGKADPELARELTRRHLV